MEIFFGDKKLAETCSDTRRRRKALGENRGRRLGRRLDDLAAASSLEDIRTLPGRCHELKGDRARRFAVDLDGPYRLIFEPAHNPLPMNDDGGLIWSEVRKIRILEIGNYHG